VLGGTAQFRQDLRGPAARQEQATALAQAELCLGQAAIDQGGQREATATLDGLAGVVGETGVRACCAARGVVRGKSPVEPSSAATMSLWPGTM